MVAEEVGAGSREEFLDYCRRHRRDHDESFLSEHDLASFDPGRAEEAAFLLRVEGRARGAAALMLRPELRAAGKARFRLFHVEPELGAEAEAEGYRLLLRGLLPRAAGLEWIYLFLPERAAGAAALLPGLGFEIERYAWLLERELGELPAPELPPGLTLREARLREEGGRPGPDAAAWCRAENAAFEGIAGHALLLPERLAAEIDPGTAFPGSFLALEEEGREGILGLVSTIRDAEDEEGRSAYLGPIAVLPGLQGRGLGRALLRAGLGAAKAAGLSLCCLSVNSENRRAAELYLAEGFRERELYLCWRLRP